MSDLTNMTTAGVRCDGDGGRCPEEIRGPEISIIKDEYQRHAADLGWSIWNGRSRRHYCPQHAPKPGHKMRRWFP
jgi:hypothetical protein